MRGWQVESTADVDIVYRWAGWEVTAAWPQRHRRDIHTIIEVRYHGVENPRLVLSPTRLNLLSSSAKASVLARMRAAKTATDDAHLEEFFQHCCSNLMEWHRRDGATIRPDPKHRDGDGWLLYPIWPASGGTLVAAGTNSFKSLVLCAAAVQATLGAEVLHGNTSARNQTPVLFLDWESDEAVFGERLHAILRGADLTPEPCVAYRHLRVPLVDAAEIVADEIGREGYGGVIIDSLSAAAGGSLVDDELANQFWSAVAFLQTPALVAAHKSAEKIARGRKGVFGSVMHENRSRMLWDATRQPKTDRVLWEVVSDNNTGRIGNKLAWTVTIDVTGELDADGYAAEDAHLDRIEFRATNPKDVRLAAVKGTESHQILEWSIIEEGPAMASELAKRTGIKLNTADKALKKHSQKFIKLPDGRWAVKQ